jgi:hypothetical protein
VASHRLGVLLRPYAKGPRSFGSGEHRHQGVRVDCAHKSIAKKSPLPFLGLMDGPGSVRHAPEHGLRSPAGTGTTHDHRLKKIRGTVPSGPGLACIQVADRYR